MYTIAYPRQRGEQWNELTWRELKERADNDAENDETTVRKAVVEI
jgi:hypothetical protein